MLKKIEIDSANLQRLFGALDSNIEFIEKELLVKTAARDGYLEIMGEEKNVILAHKLIKSLLSVIAEGAEIDRIKIRECLSFIAACEVVATAEAAKGRRNEEEHHLKTGAFTVTVTAKGRQISCKTPGQKEYVTAMKNNTIVFGIGPAGTGKTYLAVASAYAALKAGVCERIILTRPALEAGEKLGFLPGDLQTKIDPYLRPLYDALGEMFGLESYQKLLDRAIVEVAPLAYMRGRTLSNAYIILDEAQNTTEEQMKMFLTRLGFKSKMFITGDITQIDLPFNKSSGLIQAARLLNKVEGIAVCHLNEKDVVRHELVQRIVLAYAKNDE